MFVSLSGLARRAALAGAGLALAMSIAGCQGAPTTPTVQPTASQSTGQGTGQFFGGQLPPELPQDPAAGFGSVELIQGTTITLTAGRAGFFAGQAPGGQAPDSQTPRARTQGGQGQTDQGQAGQGGQFQGGQGQRGQGGQFQGGQGQGSFASGSASVVSLEPATKYFKGVSPASSVAEGGSPAGAPPSGTPGAQAVSPRGAGPSGTPQPGNGTPGPGAAQQNGGRADRQFTMTVEPATAADLQIGSLVMVWGSVIDGRIYADVVYILPTGPGR